MKHDLNIWKKLYDVANQWKISKPWQKIWSNEWVKIDLPDDNYYCSIMGKWVIVLDYPFTKVMMG